MSDLVKSMAVEQLQEAIKVYGLEGTVECIERCYSEHEVAKNYLKQLFSEYFLKK